MNRTVTYLWGHLPLTRAMRGAIIFWLTPKFNVGVMGLVRDEQGNVLLLRHTYRGGRPWGLPGGGLKPGEMLEECLRREIREEVGIEVEIDALLSLSSHRNRRVVDMIFACHPAGGETLDNFKSNAEIDEARFFTPDGLPQAITSGQVKLVRMALRQAAASKSGGFQVGQGEMS
ncbi:MAG: NUDIX hydrolase [Chloroflexi bacterium]|nr:NUDIX hydrolase [Chloroflexota bacterium]